MTIALPDPIRAYFRADATGDHTALSSCFAPDAVAHDEGSAHRGIADIASWMISSKAKYGHSVEPLQMRQQDGRVIVTARVAGAFPNSPVTLDFAFTVADDRIVELGIA